MSERVSLPPGCAGFTTADGRTLPAKAGSTMTLEDNDHARLMKSAHAANGLISNMSYRLGTKKGRWCAKCLRLWQAWSLTCPKCGRDTVAS